MSKSVIIPLVFSIVLWIIILPGCNSGSQPGPEEPRYTRQKIGILLVSHGSHSATWRNALLGLETNVRDVILQDGRISDVRTAFMEYTEPSIATRMKEFDREGYTDVILVPVFLTVSPHTFEDIPTIIGKKEDPHSMELLKLEKIERYVAEAETHITPLLDFTKILQDNVLRRVRDLSVDPANEGLVLIGYGDEDYEAEWIDLFNTIADSVTARTGISEHAYGWCGHIASYDPKHTADAINTVLQKTKTALVIPVLVAQDEMFQVDIIGSGIEQVGNYKKRVIYKPDAILPDKNVEQWIIDIVAEYVQKIAGRE